MIRFLLDTDHASLQERGHTALLARLRLHPPAEIAFSIVTVEEVCRGRLAVLARPLPPGERAIAYRSLWQTVRFFAAAQIVLYDDACERKFHNLRAQKIRIGTRDLRIAATALVHDLTLVTRNRSDFSRVPSLRIEDWSAG
jgi:tRNA(fMet)-specific endonuclease VapC